MTREQKRELFSLATEGAPAGVLRDYLQEIADYAGEVGMLLGAGEVACWLPLGIPGRRALLLLILEWEETRLARGERLPLRQWLPF